MARKKTSPFEDLIDIASKLPWWVGVLLALISYVLLHAVASRPVMAGANPAKMGDALAKNMMTSFAMFGQFILPFAFSAGALISGVNSIKQKKIYDRVEARSEVAVLNEMSWEDFERLVGEYYKRRGFQVTREGGNGPDGGIDLVLRQNNETHLVQCKQWKAYKVGVQPVREFYGIMTSRGAAGGYFVTSGVYTGEAQAFVKGLNLQLVDGVKLKKMIDAARKNPLPPTHQPELQQEAVIPVCPKCGSEMKKRVARQGNNSGKEFWGCVAFPKCKGTRALENSATALQ